MCGRSCRGNSARRAARDAVCVNRARLGESRGPGWRTQSACRRERERRGSRVRRVNSDEAKAQCRVMERVSLGIRSNVNAVSPAHLLSRVSLSVARVRRVQLGSPSCQPLTVASESTSVHTTSAQSLRMGPSCSFANEQQSLTRPRRPPYCAFFSPSTFQNSASASFQTRSGPLPTSDAVIAVPCRGARSASACGSVSSEGSRSVENASDASRGRSVGRWSIETTVIGGPEVMLREKRIRVSSPSYAGRVESVRHQGRAPQKS